MVKTNHVLVVATILLIVLGVLFFIGWENPFVSADFPESFVAGDKLQGDIFLTIEEGDSVADDVLVLLSLNRGDEVLSVETLTFEELMNSANEQINFVERDGKKYYETPGTYSIDISKIMDFEFSEAGEYELFFAILKLDIGVLNKIVVE